MKKRWISLILVVLTICFTVGCGGGKKATGVTSQAESNSQMIDKESAVDMKKLDETMIITEALLKNTFGSDYSLVYDQGGVVISFWHENMAQTVSFAKRGESNSVEVWNKMVENMQGLTTKMQEILEQYGISGIPVTAQYFDEKDKNTALCIVVDGKVTYDASK